MNYHKTFNIGKKDNERFNLYSMKRKTLRMSGMVFLVITFMVTLTQLTEGNRFSNSILNGAAYGIAGILVFVIANYMIVKLRLSLFYQKGKIKPFIQQIEMNEREIHAKTENGSVHVIFDQIGGVKETKHAFYITVSPEHVYVFPKDQMSDEKEIRDVRDIFKAGISLNKLKLYA